VRRFILEHPTDIDLRKVDQLWFLDLITNGLFAPPKARSHVIAQGEKIALARIHPESKIPSARRGLRHNCRLLNLTVAWSCAQMQAEIKPANQELHPIPEMEEHEQVWVKVNAPVDAGVAQIVSALSSVDLGGIVF